MSEEGIVYVLSNEAMPGLVKIGLTGRKDLEARLGELYNTSVPVPFTCEYACKVKDCASVESALHQAFSTDRINPSREFFKTSVERIIPILKLLQIEEITTSVSEDMNKTVPQSDIQAANTLKKKRPPLNFEEMGIHIGSELVMSYNDIEYKAVVSSPRTVTYNGTEYHLSPLTKEIIHSEWNVQPTPYWFYNGRLLSDIYDETYARDAE